MKQLLLLIAFLTLLATACDTSKHKKEEPVKAKNRTPELELFTAPDTATLKDDAWGKQVKYGARLVRNTAYYIGPNGIVSHNLGNKMNCTNCHLDAGTKPYGLNFFDSHRTYPQYRAREDKILTMSDRVNNCIERPHNGKALVLDSKEMIAIVSYIKWVGEDYDPAIHKGYGIKYINYDSLSADPVRGEAVYIQHCKTCHQADGAGQMTADKSTYTNPPLWGPKSYQVGSSMHRVLKAASFIRANMPNKLASWENPVLTEQEALDVAAFVNDGRIHPRPKSTRVSYANINTKPVDYFEGPYLDSFPTLQHIFGPWTEIEAFYKNKGMKIHK